MRRLTATILVLECVVIGLAVPVAAQVSGVELRTAAVAAAALVAAALVLVALLRFRWAYAAVGVWHGCVIATGLAVSVMFFLGAVFAALWATALWMARQHEPLR